MLQNLRSIALATGLILTALPTTAAEITVAVAANFQGTLEKLASEYQKKSGDSIVAVPGATGALYAQITNGAPVDIFLAADTARPAKLETDGLAAAHRTYAVGKLVLIDRSEAATPVPDRVKSADRTIAIAKPEVAPYGAAAKAVLIGARGQADWNKNVVMGESVGQTFAYVATGSAPMAFVALSQTKAADFKASVTEVPQTLYDPILQDGVLLKRAAPAAKGFWDWLAGPEAAAIIQADGYGTGDK
jgi:molybdate transport system substrate-binding protein